MSKVQTIDMDVMCELASAIVERQYYKDHEYGRYQHSFVDKNGDIRYVEEVQDEFNKVLDLLDDILNPEI